jgi:hypothetical protein
MPVGPGGKWRPMTRPEWEADRARREKLRQATDAAILAGVEAAGRGEDIAAAMRAANEAARPRFALPAPDGEISVDTQPRLSGDGWTAEKQRLFLLQLAETGCISHACDAVGLSRQSAYKLRRRASNSVFAIGWDVAIHMARQAMLDEATERAFAGREVAVWYHGEQVGKRIVHNDRLLMFLLGQKREPLHPVLDARELTHLFPVMLKMVDTILPPPFSAERIAALAGEPADDDEDG